MMINKFRLIGLFLLLLVGKNGLSQQYAQNQILAFSQNKGQHPPQVVAHTNLPNGELFVENNTLTYHFFETNPLLHGLKNNDEPKPMGQKTELKHHVYKATFINANPNIERQYAEQRTFIYNDYTNQKPEKWIENIKNFGAIKLLKLYKGIDLNIYYNENNQLKYDLIVEPNANPKQIQIQYEGLKDSIELTKDGNLIIRTTVGYTIEKAPYTYQIINGQKTEVKCHYKLKNNLLTYVFPNGYNKNYALVIDPTLIFSSYTGSFADNWGFTATYDKDGNLYAGGIHVLSSTPGSYPTTIGAYSRNFSGGETDMVISKFNANGNALLYSTYLGGTDNDLPMSLVTNQNDELFVLGKTESNDFPTTLNTFDNTHNGNYDLIITKFSPTGQLIASTFVGGNQDDGEGFTNNGSIDNKLLFNYGDVSRGEIILDPSGNVYVACNSKSSNFPTTFGAVQRNISSSKDGVVFKMNSSLTNLTWATFLGGNDDDAVYGLYIDPNLNVYATGGTASNNFPIGLGSGHTRNYQGGQADGFIVRLNPSGSTILNGTYIGTSAYDQSYFIQADNTGQIFVYGQSKGNMPVSQNVYSNTNGKQFIARYTTNLTNRTLSTVFGANNNNNPNISPTAFLVDVCNRIYLAGWGSNLGRGNSGSTRGLPITANAFQSQTDNNDLYLMVLDSNAANLTYGTYIGGNRSAEHVDGGTCRFDKQGIVYHAVCAGCGRNSDFPITNNNVSNTNNSRNCNMAVFKLDFKYIDTRANFAVQPSDLKFCGKPARFTFSNLSSGQTNFYWDFGDGSPISRQNPASHTYNNFGTYRVKIFVENCVSTDSLVRTINVFPLPKITIDTVGLICPLFPTLLRARGTRTYQWLPNPTLTNGTTPTPTVAPAQTTTYYVIGTDTNGCSIVDSITVRVRNYANVFGLKNENICKGEFVNLGTTIDSSRIQSWQWRPAQGINNPNDRNPTVRPRQTTWYYIQARTFDGCNITDSMLVTVEIKVFINAGPDRTICEKESATITATGATRYEWSTGQTTPTITVRTDSLLKIWVIGYIGLCESLADTITITVNIINPSFRALPDTGVAPQVVRITNNTTGANTFSWNFGDGSQNTSGTNPQHLYTRMGRYRITMLARNNLTGCIDSTFTYVVVDTAFIVIPNVITLNDDKLNDDFFVVTKNMKSVKVEIYNRWGEKIFESTENPKFRWDGKFKGEKVPQGAYVYQIWATAINDVVQYHKGTISVVR